MSSDAIEILTSQLTESVGYNQATPNGRDEIAHVVFLDLVGFTKLRAAKQRLILGRLQEIVRLAEDFCAARDANQLIALPTGDGMALVFLTTVDGSGPAISCAEKIAEAVIKYNETTTEDDAKLKVRIGIHSGNVVRVSDVNDRPNVAGEGINTAQRVMDCGDIGHILLSNHAFHLLPAVPDRTDQCQPLGKVKVKHDQEVRIYNLFHDQIGNRETPRKVNLQAEEAKRLKEAKDEGRKAEKRRQLKWMAALGVVAIIAVVIWWLTRTPYAAPTLAVLPFTPVSQEKHSSRAVSKGLTEQFIRSFGYLTDIKPQSLNTVKDVLKQSSSSETETSRLYTALEAGKKLKVRYVLTGTVESYNNDANLDNLKDVNSDFAVDVQAELYDTDAGQLVWNKDYPAKPFNDLTALHKSIIKEVADKVGITIRDNRHIEELDTKLSSAHWHYMLGRFWSAERTNAADQKQSSEITIKAIWNYEKAIEFDRSYALAHAGLADEYVSIGGMSMDPIKAKEKAVKAAADAPCVECPPEVYGSIGTESWWLERNFLTARLAFQLAIKSNPHPADSHKRYSSLLAAQGKADEAEKEVQVALEMEPDSTIFQLTSGQNYFFAQKYDQAISQLQKLISIDPKPAAYRFLAMALEQKNLNQEALAQLEKSAGKCEEDRDCLSARGHIFAHMKQVDKALKIAESLQKLRDSENRKKENENKNYVSPYNIAVIYAEIPNKHEDALRWLDIAIREYDPRVAWLKVDPRFTELQKARDPDFKERLLAAGLLP